MTLPQGWVGVDLDGTLAVYDGWKGPKYIGKPIPAIVDYVKALLEANVEVRIFTARCQEGPEVVEAIKTWCLEHIGRRLMVTDRKDFSMVFALDDRIVSVEPNTGRMLVEPPRLESIRNHWNTSAGAPDPNEFKRD